MSLFDGMAGVLSDVFGTPITFLPQDGEPVVVQSIFRETPIEVDGDNGEPTLITAATWRAPRDQVTARRGDRIRLADGREFRIRNQAPSGSPATDAFTIYELEKAE